MQGRSQTAEDLVGESWHTSPAELGGQISRGKRRSLGAGGLLAYDLQNGGRADVELGRWIPSSSSSQSVTSASSSASRMCAKRSLTSMPGWISC
jgi:hypothetical protein